MAKNIREGAPNVVSIDSGKKARARKPKATPAASAPDQAPDEERAPAFGHNQPTAEDVRRWAHGVIAIDAWIDEQKLVMKDLRGKRRDYRSEAKGAGIILRELDDSIEELLTEEVDLLERQERLNFYRRALNLPVYVEGAKKAAKPKTSAEDEGASWRKRGAQAHLLNKPRDLPEGIPGEHVQAFLAGWDEEAEKTLRKSPLTAGAFRGNPAGGVLDEGLSPGQAAPVTENGHLVLREHHFKSGIDLKDANLKTLLADHQEAFRSVDRVVAIFGGKRRVLREPDADLPGGFYEDDGLKADVSLEEPVGVPAEDLA